MGALYLDGERGVFDGMLELASGLSGIHQGETVYGPMTPSVVTKLTQPRTGSGVVRQIGMK